MIQFNSHSGKQVEQIKSQIGSVNGINKNGVACKVSSHGTYGGKNLKPLVAKRDLAIPAPALPD